jgi:IS30 family transposase
MEQRRLARRLSAKGMSLREIGRQVGCSHEVVRTVVRRESKRPVRSDSWRPRPGRLTLADRKEISLGLHDGDSFTAIAARLGKATSTVSREVAATADGAVIVRGGRTRGPCAGAASEAVQLSGARLAGQVTAWLKDWWSPQEISHRLRIEYANDPTMHVSHETI